jgi:superfamily I DNA and/or RNA helicase
MPSVIADFVSQQFYGNQLTTATGPRTLPGPFRSPLAIVDTADQIPTQRAERNRPRSETWQAAGRDNLAEARLVVDLVQRYAQAGRDWAVIAPYRAQVQFIDGRLRAMLGADAVTDRVGTVDAFQGKENDIVIYSFTRSNAGGEVGFLAELRRLNVAITRARAQLVLIGDFSTLCRARHGGFRQLAGGTSTASTACRCRETTTGAARGGTSRRCGWRTAPISRLSTAWRHSGPRRWTSYWSGRTGRNSTCPAS